MVGVEFVLTTIAKTLVGKSTALYLGHATTAFTIFSEFETLIFNDKKLATSNESSDLSCGENILFGQIQERAADHLASAGSDFLSCSVRNGILEVGAGRISHSRVAIYQNDLGFVCFGCQWTARGSDSIDCEIYCNMIPDTPDYAKSILFKILRANGVKFSDDMLQGTISASGGINLFRGSPGPGQFGYPNMITGRFVRV